MAAPLRKVDRRDRWWCAMVLASSLVGCAPDESDALRWYQAHRAPLDDFDGWVRSQIANAPGIDRESTYKGISPEFRYACELWFEQIGVIGGDVAIGYSLTGDAVPATQLCSADGVPGWTRSGVAAQDSETTIDGRRLGWGEYWDEAKSERRKGLQVLWRIEQGDAVVEIDVIVPAR